MNGCVDELLSSICHRAGNHSDVLPLCLRCSSVYAGVVSGVVLEAALHASASRSRSRSAYLIGAIGLAVMTAVGFGELCGLFPVAEYVKVFSALYFGAAVAFFAIAAIDYELGTAGRQKSGGHGLRAVLLGVLALWAARIVSDGAWALKSLGPLAGAGLVCAFSVVNFAFAVVLLRSIVRRRMRVVYSLPVMGLLAVAEFALFAVWRRL